MFKTIKNDIKTIFKKVPVVKSIFEALICYPRLHAIWIHRIYHFLYKKSFFF